MPQTKEYDAGAVFRSYGVSVGAVSKWESGQMNPEIGMIVKIADYFGLSVDYLLVILSNHKVLLIQWQ